MADEGANYEEQFRKASERYEKILKQTRRLRQFLEDCNGSGVTSVKYDETERVCTINYKGKGGQAANPVKIDYSASDGGGISAVTVANSTSNDKIYTFKVGGSGHTVTLKGGVQGAPGKDGEYVKDTTVQRKVSLTGASFSATGASASVTGVKASFAVYSITADVLKLLFNFSSVSFAVVETAFNVASSAGAGNLQKNEGDENKLQGVGGQNDILDTDIQNLDNENSLMNMEISTSNIKFPGKQMNIKTGPMREDNMGP